MQKYLCEPCGYIYDPEEGDPENGIEPDTAFEDLPDDWECPECGVGKEEFVPIEKWGCLFLNLGCSRNIPLNPPSKGDLRGLVAVGWAG